MTFAIEILRGVVLIYSLYLILSFLPAVLFPAVWREMANDVAKQAEAHIRKRAMFNILIGFVLYLVTRIQ
jgi:uncharacterized protein YjeT (DUF2065 family)